jgi:hypothetical protein
MSAERVNPGLIDWRLPLGGGLLFRLVERPGLLLPRAELASLVEGLRGVADRCVGVGRLRYGVLSGERERLADAVVAGVYRRATGEMVGFNAMVVLDVTLEGRPERVVHTGLCLVDPDLRSRGLCVALTAAPALLSFLRNRCAPLWFTNVTQVPAAAGVFGTALEDVFPAPGRAARPSPDHARIVSEVVARHRAAFGVGDDAVLDEEAFVIRNAYTGGSDWLKKGFADCAQHRDARFNAWCAELLDYERGDDVIQVGRMSGRQWLRVALRLFRELRPRRPLPPRTVRPAWSVPANARGQA